MAGAACQEISMEFLRTAPAGTGQPLTCFQPPDGFEIEVNFDRNVSCLIAVDVFMDNDFFNQAVKVAVSNSVMSAYS